MLEWLNEVYRQEWNIYVPSNSPSSLIALDLKFSGCGDDENDNTPSDTIFLNLTCEQDPAVLSAGVRKLSRSDPPSC